MAPIDNNNNTQNDSVTMNQMLKVIPLRNNPQKELTLADYAYEHVLKEIVFPEESDSTVFEYGSKITESVLAKALQMSNGPVREAIFRLRHEGWIRTVGNKGSFLVDFSEPEIARELYLFRLSFETGAFYSLAASITSKQIEVLREILDVMEAAQEESDVVSFRKADISFHLQTIEFAGGKGFKQLFRSKLLQWYAMAFRVLMDSMGSEKYSQCLEAPGASSHRALFDAVSSHNCERAAQLINDHYSYLALLLGLGDQKSGNVA
jgi:DNA-binding GntR family transcriptional regulator